MRTVQHQKLHETIKRIEWNCTYTYYKKGPDMAHY